jgi:hypothetical protein|tara:strand:+ start:45 stop:752 length:708 start_codon:yes stop_codon:yes gene_type:complete
MNYLPYIKSSKLLNIDKNAKTVKGQKKGYKTAILYLAPSTQSGFQVCPMASEGCKKACLYTAGHGAFNNVQQGRINKTRWFIQERNTFMDQLKKEINNHIKNATRKGFIPCIRLNGTSDISWETTGIFEEFPQVQFYDYTKIYKRALKFVNGQYPSNYHLTYSLNEDNYKEAFDILLKGGNISAVFRNELPETYKGYRVINADETDLRFTDDNNIIAGLMAKGKAKKDYSGFVLD